MDKRKEFVVNAIKNGYTGNQCKGWDWIRNNLSLLDNYFQREDYKACNGMKYQCMPILSEGLSLSYDEERVLSTAWYLNNERDEKRAKEEYQKKMLADGWLPLTTEIVKKALEEDKKIELNAESTNDWMTVKVNKIFKPHKFGDNYGLMPLRAKTKGYSLSQFKKAFIKLI